jgi:hypothetical protein
VRATAPTAVAAAAAHPPPPLTRRTPPRRSGLDNAGKTTAVKQLCGEDATLVAPTLGFAIRTLHLGGCAFVYFSARCRRRSKLQHS